MTTFEANKTYKMTFIGDSNLIIPILVVARTAKTVKIKLHGEIKTCRIKSYDDSEYIFPEGTYSMAPTCYARKPY